MVSSSRPTPLTERTYSEITVMLNTNQVPFQVEVTIDSCARVPNSRLILGEAWERSWGESAGCLGAQEEMEKTQLCLP